MFRPRSGQRHPEGAGALRGKGSARALPPQRDGCGFLVGSNGGRIREGVRELPRCRKVGRCVPLFPSAEGGVRSVECRVSGASRRRIPKGFRLKAQGCEERATLGIEDRRQSTLKAEIFKREII